MELHWIHEDGTEQHVRARLFSSWWWLLAAVRVAAIGHTLPWTTRNGCTVDRDGKIWTVTA